MMVEEFIESRCTINLSNAATQGGVKTDAEFLQYRSTGSRDLLQWAVGLQRRRRWRRLLVLKAKVAE